MKKNYEFKLVHIHRSELLEKMNEFGKFGWLPIRVGEKPKPDFPLGTLYEGFEILIGREKPESASARRKQAVKTVRGRFRTSRSNRKPV